jgi:hypothetical protein
MLEHEPTDVPGNRKPVVQTRGTGLNPVPWNASLTQRPTATPAEAAPTCSQHGDKRLPEILTQDPTTAPADAAPTRSQNKICIAQLLT